MLSRAENEKLTCKSMSILDRNNLLSVIRAHEAQDQGVSIAQSSIRLILHR